ncbi:TPA: hypothetical protein QCX89_005160 [Bacillus cereus]|nr:hypothetical protein [Bacillus cereus]
MKNTKGEIEKTVTKMQQTNEKFNKSIETLTKKGAITNKLNIVEVPAKVDAGDPIEGHIYETDKKEGTKYFNINSSICNVAFFMLN